MYIVPTRYGFLYAAVILFLLSLATIFNSSDCLFATALLVTFGVVCMHQTHLNILSLSINEVESQSGFANEVIPWRFKISNRRNVESFSIGIFEDILDIPARETSIQNVSIHPQKRGYFHVEEIKISSTYPLGLFYAWKWSDIGLSYYVYPTLGNPEIVLSNITNRRTELETRDDFIGHRDYVVGDSAHHIDWKAQARKQKLLVKLFETTHTNASWLDWSKVPGRDVEERLSILTRAVYECHQTQTPFGLMMPNMTVPIASGTPHFEMCLRYLATFEEKNEKVA